MLNKYYSWSHIRPTTIPLEEIMDKKIKDAAKSVVKKVKSEEKGLLKEDKKLDKRVETAESKLRKMKKPC